MTAAQSWERALDELEARLELADAILDLNGEVEPLPPFATPPVDGPLPAPLAERARAALERSEALQARMEQEVERIRTELRGLPKLAPPPGRGRFEVDA